MIPARKVKYAPGSRIRAVDPAIAMQPQVIALQGRRYWATSANGAAVISVTAPDATDFASGQLAVMVYQDAQPGFTEGLALLRTFDPDQADEFADQLRAYAQIVRDAAGVQASANLRKAAGK